MVRPGEQDLPPELMEAFNQLPEALVLQAVDQSKELGDAAAQAQDWSGAETHYTNAIAGALRKKAREAMLPVLFKNRSAARLQLSRPEDALADARAALSMDASDAKAHYRAGRALFASCDFAESERYFSAAAAHAKRSGSGAAGKAHGKLTAEEKDIHKWKLRAAEEREKAANRKAAEAAAAEKKRRDAAAAKKIHNRYAVDYSRFELAVEAEGGEEAATGPNDGDVENGLVLEPTEHWFNMKRRFHPTFDRQSAVVTLQLLGDPYQPLPSGLAGGLAALDSDRQSLTAIHHMLADLAVLRTPARRLAQLRAPSVALAWQAAISTIRSTGAWLVAGGGAGATGIWAARRAAVLGGGQLVFLLTTDLLQPSLATALANHFAGNKVSLGAARAVGQQPSLPSAAGESSVAKATLGGPRLAGLKALRKPTPVAPAADKAPAAVPLVKPTVVAVPGSLEANMHTMASPSPDLSPEAKPTLLVLDPEIFDDGLLGRRLLPSLRAAHRSLLAPGAQVVPRRGRLFTALAEICPFNGLEGPVSGASLDFSPLVTRFGWAPSNDALPLRPEDFLSDGAAAGSTTTSVSDGIGWKCLSAPQLVWDFNFSDGAAMLSLPDHASHRLEFQAISEGTWNAMVCWFDLNLGGSEAPVASFDSGYWRPCVHWLPPSSLRGGEACLVDVERSDTATSFVRLTGGTIVALPREIVPLVCAPTPEKEGTQADDIPVLDTDAPPDPVRWNPLKARLPTWRWGTTVLSRQGVAESFARAIQYAVVCMRRRRQSPSAGGVHALELQCGASFASLSMLAKTAGASQILACDTSPRLLDLCAALASFNAMPPGAGLRFSPRRPEDLSLGDPLHGLTRRTDLLLLGVPDRGRLLDAGLLSMLKAIRRADVLSRDSIFVPARVRLHLRLVAEHLALPSADPEQSSASGAMPPVDFSAFQALPLEPVSSDAAKAGSAVELDHWPHACLSDDILFAEWDMAELVASGVDPHLLFPAAALEVPVVESGSPSHIAWWWEMVLPVDDGEANVSSAPGTGSNWSQTLVPMPLNSLQRGQVLQLQASLSPDLRSISFTVDKATPTPALPKDNRWVSSWDAFLEKEKMMQGTLGQQVNLFEQGVSAISALSIDPGAAFSPQQIAVIDNKDTMDMFGSFFVKE